MAENRTDWRCPTCDGQLISLNDPNRRKRLPERPERYHNPLVECARCGQEYSVQLIPRNRTNTHVCPQCDRQLTWGSISTLRCEDCEREFEIRERSWLEFASE